MPRISKQSGYKVSISIVKRLPLTAHNNCPYKILFHDETPNYANRNFELLYPDRYGIPILLCMNYILQDKSFLQHGTICISFLCCCSKIMYVRKLYILTCTTNNSFPLHRLTAETAEIRIIHFV